MSPPTFVFCRSLPYPRAPSETRLLMIVTISPRLAGTFWRSERPSRQCHTCYLTSRSHHKTPLIASARNHRSELLCCGVWYTSQNYLTSALSGGVGQYAGYVKDRNGETAMSKSFAINLAMRCTRASADKPSPLLGDATLHFSPDHLTYLADSRERHLRNAQVKRGRQHTRPEKGTKTKTRLGNPSPPTAFCYGL